MVSQFSVKREIFACSKMATGIPMSACTLTVMYVLCSCHICEFAAGGGVHIWSTWLHSFVPWRDGWSACICKAFLGKETKAKEEPATENTPGVCVRVCACVYIICVWVDVFVWVGGWLCACMCVCVRVHTQESNRWFLNCLTEEDPNWSSHCDTHEGRWWWWRRWWSAHKCCSW